MSFTKDEIPTVERHFERAIQQVRHAQSAFEIYQFFDEWFEANAKDNEGRDLGFNSDHPLLQGGHRCFEIAKRELKSAMAILQRLFEAMS